MHEHSNMGASISRITQKMSQVIPTLVSPSFRMETHRKGPFIEFVSLGVGPLSKFGGDKLGFVELGVHSVAFDRRT